MDFCQQLDIAMEQNIEHRSKQQWNFKIMANMGASIVQNVEELNNF